MQQILSNPQVLSDLTDRNVEGLIRLVERVMRKKPKSVKVVKQKKAAVGA